MDIGVANLRAANTAKKFQDWGLQPAVEYLGRFSAKSFGASGDGHNIADYGFTATGLTLADGSGASFPSAGFSSLTYGTPGSCTLADDTDAFQSPAVFAGPMEFLSAARVLGQTKPPNIFFIEWWMALTTDSNAQTRTGAGLVKAGSTVGVDASAAAWIYSDGTNLRLRSSAVTVAAVGPLITEQLLLHRLEINRAAQTLTWKISTDGLTFLPSNFPGGANPTVAIQATSFPASFGAKCTTNNVAVLYGDMRAGYI